MNNIYCAISNKIINKSCENPKDYATSFLNCEITIDTFFEAVAVNGWAVSAQQDGTRCADNFSKANILLVDIDDGMTLKTALNHPFYNEYAAGYYTTNSHTDAHNKFRIIFVTERIIDNADDMKKLYTALIKIFGGDEACKDASRLFYGSVNSKYEINHDKLLENAAIDALIESVDNVVQPLQKINYVESELTDLKKQYVIETIQKWGFIGHYPTWSKIAWAMQEGGFNLNDFSSVTNFLMVEKSAQDCEKVWKSYQPGRINMGWLINILRENVDKDFMRHEDRSEKQIANLEDLKKMLINK